MGRAPNRALPVLLAAVRVARGESDDGGIGSCWLLIVSLSLGRGDRCIGVLVFAGLRRHAVVVKESLGECGSGVRPTMSAAVADPSFGVGEDQMPAVVDSVERIDADAGGYWCF